MMTDIMLPKYLAEIGYKNPDDAYFDTNTLVEGADLDAAPLCIDIGGHHGIGLSRVVDKHPTLPNGSLVLQDLPKCLSEVKGLSEKITMMPYDFFTPQPVKANAMKKGYSKLLLNDIVMPRTGASLTQTVMDMQVMALGSAYERTEPMWTSLLQSAGLKIVKIWPDGCGYESVVEAELA
ncbi:S-adenosyl-L-methionine-dependent methyltransferase [Nemania abortiva]|nr:S-adenosyl-L-methionine-dependent methyltransferase [Nemania abortiva]